jgi:hypothetical protein
VVVVVDHRAETRNEGNQDAAHSLGKTAVLRYTHHAEKPSRQVGFSLPLDCTLGFGYQTGYAIS